jgi:hypothetical protein
MTSAFWVLAPIRLLKNEPQSAPRGAKRRMSIVFVPKTKTLRPFAVLAVCFCHLKWEFQQPAKEARPDTLP